MFSVSKNVSGNPFSQYTFTNISERKRRGKRYSWTNNPILVEVHKKVKHNLTQRAVFEYILKNIPLRGTIIIIYRRKQLTGTMPSQETKR